VRALDPEITKDCYEFYLWSLSQNPTNLESDFEYLFLTKDEK
jgi:hypothetical protein